MSGNTSRKHGSNSDACKLYASSHREERNKKRHVARMERFKKAKEAKIARRIKAKKPVHSRHIAAATKAAKGTHTLLGIGITYLEAKKLADSLGLTKPFIERSESQRTVKDKEGNDRLEIRDAWRYAHHFAEEAA